MGAVEDLTATCGRICTVLRGWAEQFEEQDDPRAELCRKIIRALEADVRLVRLPPADETPAEGLYIDRLLLGLEHPLARPSLPALRWMRHRWHEGVVLVRGFVNIVEVYQTDTDYIEAAKRWLDRVVMGPGELGER